MSIYRSDQDTLSYDQIADSIQLEQGTTATAYSPYKAPTTITIPTAIATGKSAGSVYDTNEFYSVETDGVTKYYCKHTQRVGSYTFTESDVWAFDTGWTEGQYCYVFRGLTLKAKGLKNVLSDTYTTNTSAYVGSMSNNRISGYSNDNRIFIRDDSVTTLADFTTKMIGKVINYELATPIVTTTELSQNLFDALAVEGGGSITFVGNNENYHLPMANSEEYLVYLNEVSE